MDDSNGRTIVKGGVWQVPPDQRPVGWERMPCREGIPEQPTSEEVIAVLDTVVNDTERAATPDATPNETLDAPVEETAPKAAFDKQSYQAEYRAKWRQAREEFQEIATVIDKSAEWFGADEWLTLAAKIMVAGMWTRKPSRIRMLVDSTDKGFTERVSARYSSCRIWEDPAAVWIGSTDKEGDIGFWLNAMVGTGEIDLVSVDDAGEGTYQAVTPDPKRLGMD